MLEQRACDRDHDIDCLLELLSSAFLNGDWKVGGCEHAVGI